MLNLDETVSQTRAKNTIDFAFNYKDVPLA